MNEDFQNEVAAINSIYGDDSINSTSEEDTYVLRLPQHDVSLRLQFPHQYPATPPSVVGIESSGEHTRKGDAARVVKIFRDVLGRIYQPGEVCLFDVIEDVIGELSSAIAGEAEEVNGTGSAEPAIERDESTTVRENLQIDYKIPWTLSDVVIESKSVFVARCAPISSPGLAKSYVQQLLDSDKKVRSATHNITAWRIKGENGITYQDCDDDGETAAGGRLLHLMQLMELWDVMVVVTRWYGGHQLGPKRFSLINTVARDAFIKGNFVQEDSSTAKKKGKK